MSLTEEAVSSLRAHIEPRPGGTMTKTGLQKLSDGTIMTRHSTEDGTRTPEQTVQAIEDDAQRFAELEVMREQLEEEEPQPKRRTRKKAAQAPEPPPAPKAPPLRQITISIPGFGGIPSQYAHVYLGDGIAVLGLAPMSFTPQAPDPKTGQPSNQLELSVNPGTKYVYLGNSFVDRFNIKNLLLVEVPEGEE